VYGRDPTDVFSADVDPEKFMESKGPGTGGQIKAKITDLKEKIVHHK
jgi:hypothetical protein